MARLCSVPVTLFRVATLDSRAHYKGELNGKQCVGGSWIQTFLLLTFNVPKLSKAHLSVTDFRNDLIGSEDSKQHFGYEKSS